MEVGGRRIRHLNPIIVALDGVSKKEAIKIVNQLKGKVWGFKFSGEFFESYTYLSAFDFLKKGVRVFADLQLVGRPEEVARRATLYRGCDFISVNIVSGMETIRAVTKSLAGSRVLVSSILTSLDEAEAQLLFGAPIEVKFVQFVREALIAGVYGVYCSPKELEILTKYEEFRKLERVVAGIRSKALPVKQDDQKRVMSSREAIELGADLLVIGRPILQNPPYLEAVNKILEEIK